MFATQYRRIKDSYRASGMSISPRLRKTIIFNTVSYRPDSDPLFLQHSWQVSLQRKHADEQDSSHQEHTGARAARERAVFS